MRKILFVLLILSSTLTAQNVVKVDLSSPKSTLNTHLYFLQSDSYEPQKAASTIYGFEGDAAQDIAIRIKMILDGKGLKVDFNRVPSDKMFADSSGVNLGHRYVLFPHQMPEIYLEKVGNNWYYSSETVSNVDAIYESVFPWYIENLLNVIPEWGQKEIFTIQIWQYLGMLILILVSVMLFYLLRKIVFYTLRKIQYWIVKTSNVKINTALRKLARPIVFLILSWFLEMMLPSLLLGIGINNILFLALNIMVTVFWIYVFLKLVQVIMSIYAEFAESTHGKLDDQLVPILDNFLTGIVIFIGFLKVLTLFGIDPVTVIAGASIGGIAVALASQDTVKNLIGTIMIFVDKPFHIGDWIEAGTVVGTVETVGFRSTTVRAADTSVYQIPNSTLSEMVVNNKGLRAYRRYTTNLGIRYDTPIQLINAFMEGVRKIIAQNPETRDEVYNVEFIGFGDSALLILLNVYFTSTDWNTEQATKSSLHLSILELAAELGVEFAFPSTTLMIEEFPEKKSLVSKPNVDKKKIDDILKKIK
jgi:MscS family membrane protein